MFVEPMLCNSVKLPDLPHFDLSGYVVEPKYDGARAIVDISSSGVEIYSRTGKKLTAHLPHLVDELSSLPSGTILDGEIILIDHIDEICGNDIAFSNFNQTMRILGSSPTRAVALQEHEYGYLSLVYYDVLQYEGDNVMNEPLLQRRALLNTITPSSHMLLSPYWEGENPTPLFDEIVSRKGEGIILKNTSSIYVPGKRPTKSFYKVKVVMEADVVIMGANDGKGKYAGMVGSINFGRFSDGEVIYVGRCSGMTDSERAWITEHIDDLVGSVMTISYNEKVGVGEYQSPRHPQFVSLREDKTPESCDGYEFKRE